jgi:twitching motility two-component system response regulator PilG
MSQLIMVIDDSVTVRKVIEVCLRRAGYAVISFPDGVKALRWLCSPGVRLPDLVFLDIGMPAMDGYAVAQYLRARPQYRQMVIVMISGRRGVLDRLKARLAGATAYLSKPCTTQSILAVVHAHCGTALVPTQVPMGRERYDPPIPIR